jgi:predicted metalloprotease with PDZ domain
MKKKLAVLVLGAVIGCAPALALTLEGSVEVNQPFYKRGFWARLFAPEPEGRIGIRISHSNGLIAYVHPGSPAEKVGLQKEDLVMAVDGRKHAVDEISGDPGTTVHLDVKRHDEEFAVDVERVDWHDIAR